VGGACDITESVSLRNQKQAEMRILIYSANFAPEQTGAFEMGLLTCHPETQLEAIVAECGAAVPPKMGGH
jgi:hypothetical protein